MREVDLFGTVREDRAECWIGHSACVENVAVHDAGLDEPLRRK